MVTLIERRALLPTCLALLSAVACARQPQAPAASTRVESATLGIALASLPAPFRLEANEGGRIVLGAPGPARLTVETGPVEQYGINLIDKVWERKAAFEALPGGKFHGNQELAGLVIAPAFTVRGSYAEGAGRVEEIRLDALHPEENRLLTMVYRYPQAGDSQQRAEQLLALLAEIELLAAPGPV